MEIGQRVRLVSDHMRVGVLTGQKRVRSSQLLLQVVFPHGMSWVPKDQLEFVSSWRESPLDLLQRNSPLAGVKDLRRTLTHVRLSGRLADVIYSMETTNTDFYPYQFKPVLKLLNSPSNGLLIADEVGLGKTIEAGLIWTELRSRYDMRKLLVVCPAVLREKWRDELYEKMGVEANIVDAQEVFRYLQDSERGKRGFALIASLQGLRPSRDWEEDQTAQTLSARLAQFLRENENEERLIDLLVIDEAHYLRNPETQTNQLGQLLRNVSEYHVFLTATPLHTQNQNLFSLLHLLDPDTFLRLSDFSDILDANRPLVESRDYVLSSSPSKETLISNLHDAENHPLLKGNRQLEILCSELTQLPNLSSNERRTHIAYRLENVNLLGHIVTRTRKRDVKEKRAIREPRSLSVNLTPAEKDFYDLVIEVVKMYADKQGINQQFLLSTPLRQVSSSMVASLRNWEKKKWELDAWEERLDEEPDWENLLGPLTQQIVERVTQEVVLEELEAWDSKYQKLKENLTEFLSQRPKEKIVLFSAFHATLDYLEECFQKDGFSTLVLKGGQRESKHETIAHFRDSRGPSILLSSEVGGEGIDLQFSWVVINYDLPWNPMRVEQRIGRVDRLGQKAEKVLIWNLFYSDTIDSRIYERLYNRLDLCRQALGDFEPILGKEIQKLERELLTGRLTPVQQEARINQTAQALANLRKEEEQLEENATHLIAHGDYILNQIHEAHNLNRWIQDVDLQTYVLDYFYLHYQGSTFHQVDPQMCIFDINLSVEAKEGLTQFIRKKSLATSTRLTRNLTAPIRCRFQNRVKAGDENGMEVISQFHPLVRFVSSEIERQEEQLTPAVAIRLKRSLVANDLLNGVYILVSALWSIQGLQTTERLMYTGCRLADPEKLLPDIQAEKIITTAILNGEDWMEAGHIVDRQEAFRVANETLFSHLGEGFQKFVDEVKAENEDRADIQERNLTTHLRSQTVQLEKVKKNHLEHGRTSLAKATEGRLEKLRNRFDREKHKIDLRRTVKPDPQKEICVSLVKITDE